MHQTVTAKIDNSWVLGFELMRALYKQQQHLVLDHVRPLSRDTFLSSGSYVSAAPVVSATWSWWSSDTWESWVEWERARVGVKHLTHTLTHVPSQVNHCSVFAFRNGNKIVVTITKSFERSSLSSVVRGKSFTILKGFKYTKRYSRHTFYDKFSRF